MSNLFEHCRTEISSASQRYEKSRKQCKLICFLPRRNILGAAKCDLPLSVRGRRRMCRRPQAERCRPLHERLRASALRLRPKSESFETGFSRPPACGIALQKQPNSHFGKHPAPPIGCLLQGADLPPFVTERWRQSPQSTSVGIGRRCSLSGHKRLRCCGAKDCTASTVAARQSPQAASALACCPSFCTPAPGARTAVRSDSSSGAMRRLLRASRNGDYSFASAHGRSPACRIALRKERKDSYAPLHSVRNDKSCHPQEEVQTNSDTGIAPASPPQTAEKKAVSDRFFGTFARKPKNNS